MWNIETVINLIAFSYLEIFVRAKVCPKGYNAITDAKSCLEAATELDLGYRNGNQGTFICHIKPNTPNVVRFGQYGNKGELVCKKEHGTTLVHSISSKYF